MDSEREREAQEEAAALGGRREGRGRLHSIDMLPPEADPDILWARAELLEHRRTQADILFELNDRLAVIGCGPISSSAFNRYSMRKAAAVRSIRETTEVARAVTETLGPDKADHATIFLSQLIRQASIDILERGGKSSKEVMEIGKAVQAIAAAEARSFDTRQKRRAEIKGLAAAATEAAADSIVAQRPELDRAEVLKKIRQEVYGIFEE